MSHKIRSIVVLISVGIYVLSLFSISAFNSGSMDSFSRTDLFSSSDDPGDVVIDDLINMHHAEEKYQQELRDSIKINTQTTTREKIKIDSEEDFISTAQENGWEGDGSEENPFIIENYSIDARGNGNAILISNTTMHFEILNCFVYNASWLSNPYLAGEGIAVYNASNGRIEGNTAFSNEGDGIDLQEASDIIVENNRAFSNSDDGVHLSNTIDSVVANNTISTNDDDGVFLQQDCKNNLIFNNTINLNGKYSILTLYSAGNRIEGNTLIKSRAGIVCSQGEDTVIMDNDIQNTDHGIYVIDTDNTTVIQNTVSDSDYGLYTSTANYNTISENTFISSELYGVTFSLNSNNNILNNNTISASQKYGLYLSTSEKNSINNNTIFSNRWIGISLYKSNNNTFRYNNITNNHLGLDISESIGNMIFNNNFIDNYRHAFADNVNYWNEKYPVGGNYWSNYKGEDLYNGPDQDEEGGDGIGDSPYVIYQEINVDRYPLMNPIKTASKLFSPSEPQNFMVNAGEGYVELRWERPADNGGSPLRNYKIYKGTNLTNIELYESMQNLGTSYFDDEVENNVTYYYYVTAVNSMGEGNRTEILSATPKYEVEVPSPPQNLTAEFDGEKVVLRWDSEPSDISVSEYYIYRGETSEDKDMIDNISGVNTVYHDEEMERNKTYYYQVSGKNSVGEGNRSDEVMINIPSLFSPPGRPQDISIEVGDGNLTLSWDPPEEDGGKEIMGYIIYRGEKSGREALYETVTDTEMFLDEGVINYRKYYYRVSAYNSVGEGELSEEVSGTPVFDGRIQGEKGDVLERNWFVFPLITIFTMLFIAKIFVIKPVIKG